MIEKIKDSWGSIPQLEKCSLDIIDRQLELSGLIATAENTMAEAFLTEKETGPKITDSKARARAKLTTGGTKTRYQYEFDTLTLLLGVVTSRISLLHQGEKPAL